jgi:predicted MFS family arabinose efflux permease
VMVVWFGWLIFFGAFTENVYGVSASVLSLLFLAGGGAEIVANNLAPLLMRNRTPRAVAYPVIIISAINLVMVGLAFDRQWTMFPFIFIGSASGAMLFVCLNIALLDSLPGDSGAVMSLQSACLEIGGSIGVAITGLGLAIIDDYEMVYRLLGVMSPLIALAVWLSARRSGPSTQAEPAIAAA